MIVRKRLNKVQSNEMLDHVNKIICTLRENQTKLKEMNDEYIKKMINAYDNGELINAYDNGECFIKMDDYKVTTANYHFFITLVGMIEAKIDKVNEFLDLIKELDDKNEILKLEKQKSYYLEKRDSVIRDFLSFDNISFPHNSQQKLISSALKEYPMYTKFSDIAKSDVGNRDLNFEFILAYCDGYTSSLDSLESILKEYESLYIDLDYHKAENEHRLSLFKPSST